MKTKLNLGNVLQKIVLFILMALCVWSMHWKLDALCIFPPFFGIFLFYVAVTFNLCDHKKAFWIIVMIAVAVLAIRMEVVSNRHWGSLVAVNRSHPEDVKMVPLGYSLLSIRDYSFERYGDQVSISDSVRQGFPQLVVHGNIDMVSILELRKKYGSLDVYKDSLAVEIKHIIDTISSQHRVENGTDASYWYYMFLVTKAISEHRFPFIYGQMWVRTTY